MSNSSEGRRKYNVRKRFKVKAAGIFFYEQERMEFVKMCLCWKPLGLAGCGGSSL